MSFQGISLEEVLAHNKALKKGLKGLVVVFVGGTSGIGEWTFRAFIKYTNSPRAYLIVRNRPVAEKIISEAFSTNLEAKIDFIAADRSLLKEVSRVCEEIKRKEDAISGSGKGAVNLLVLSQSSSGLGGRSGTPEGLDGKFSLIYHSRLLFTHLLTPLLNFAHSQERSSRVISVLLTGRETLLDLQDLDLKSKYSTSTCLAYAVIKTTLSFHHLAKINPGITYIHTNPGIVKPGVMRCLPWYMRAVSHAGYAVLSPWRMEIEESGERHLEIGFAERYASAGIKENVKGGEEVQGIARQKGAYALYNKGQSVEEKDVVWRHTLKVFEVVEKIGKTG
ncbi:hypothetical protein N431DRAFT_539882 [Stipitochalara longipes BDJ]|nr:hypothetical protein N431DRAFT_539882 [Stipitochalara longipes BDJ]